MAEKKETEKARGRKQREFESRRREILAAALKIFSQKGYHQTSMNEIAREAEFSIGSLYGFFKNKEDLFYTLLIEGIEDIEREVRPEIDRAEGAKDKLNALTMTLFSYFEKRWEAFNIFALGQREFESSLHANLGEMIRGRQIQFLELMTRIVAQGIKEGSFRPLRPENMSLAFMGLINGSIIMWLEAGRNYSLKDRGPEVLEIFYRGVEKI